MSKGKFVLGAAVGAVAGVIAGILTAPKSGKETRIGHKLNAEFALKKKKKKSGEEIK